MSKQSKEGNANRAGGQTPALIPRNNPRPLDQVRLFLRLGFALRFRKGVHLRRRIYALILA